MASVKPETDGFLAVLDQKIAALAALRESYRQALATGALGQPGEIDFPSAMGAGNGRPDLPIDLPKGALLGKSLPAAVKLWLTSARRKASVREIATALREGGMESTSPNFENVVSGALHRLKANNEVLRFKDGWAAAEFYPAALRTNSAKNAKGAKPGKAKKSKALPKSDGNKVDLILGMLPVEPTEAMSPNAIVEAMKRIGHDCSPDYVRLALRRLRERGSVHKLGKKYAKVAA